MSNTLLALVAGMIIGGIAVYSYEHPDKVGIHIHESYQRAKKLARAVKSGTV